MEISFQNREPRRRRARVEIPFAGCLMRQSRGVIKCQTNAERESRSERQPTAWHGRYTAKRRYIQCWHKPLHCINTRFSAAPTQKSGGRATSEIETQEEKAAAALDD